MLDLAHKRVFLTGGAGFIGSHIAEDLVAQGAEVTIYDNFSSGLLENLLAIQPKVRLIRGDIGDYKTLVEAMRGHDYVSHQAAQLEILKCVDDPVWDLMVNTGGTLNVLRASVQTGIKKCVLASSACVYGQTDAAQEAEDHPTRPNWAYGVSKLAAEHYARIYQTDHGLPCVNLRYAIIYGPREWYGRVFTIFLKRMFERKPLIVFGDGEQRRDFTFVTDVVRAHALALRSDKANGQTYNVSTGVATTVNELARLISDAAGGLEIIHEDVREGRCSAHMPERVRLPAELKAMTLNPAKAKADLGWAPQVDLRSGLQEQIAWLSHNLARWHTVHI